MSLSRQLICSRYIAVLGFQLSSGARKGSPRHGFHPLYRGTWYLTMQQRRTNIVRSMCFHPLYRGTWYLTGVPVEVAERLVVSIRYIAVLGI